MSENPAAAIDHSRLDSGCGPQILENKKKHFGTIVEKVRNVLLKSEMLESIAGFPSMIRGEIQMTLDLVVDAPISRSLQRLSEASARTNAQCSP